jgi:hypothetical protein
LKEVTPGGSPLALVYMGKRAPCGKGKGAAHRQLKEKEKEKEKTEGKLMRCRCHCSVHWCKERCVLRAGHRRVSCHKVGMTHVCGEHLNIEISGMRRDAGGKIMVPQAIVSELMEPLDPIDHVTDVSNGAY